MVKTKCVGCFKVLSIKARYKMFDYLKEHPSKVTVSELVKLTKLRQPTVTFHVNQLSRVGLIKKERNGREVFCILSRGCNDECMLFS